jgi:hypothetical protein
VLVATRGRATKASSKTGPWQGRSGGYLRASGGRDLETCRREPYCAFPCRTCILHDSLSIAKSFQISSLQGKKLGELYNKSNDFHIRRRAWYLPIAPTPDHPDATSKNTKKRFPTLELAHGARLRSDSYVNIRHVYSIKWSLLKEYTNCEIPTAQGFRFELESTIKVLAKGKLLTKYEAETQYQKAVLGHSVRTTNKDGPQRPTEELEKSILEPMHASAHIGQKIKDQESPVADTAPTISAVYSGTPDPSRSDFRVSGPERYRIAGTPQKVPPDIEMERRMAGPVWQPADRLLRRVAAGFEGKRPVTTFDPMVTKRPMSQFWVDAKGVMAVTIASVY